MRISLFECMLMFIMKLRNKWELASAQQSKRVLVDAEGDANVEAFDRAPRIPVAGASTVSAFCNEQGKLIKTSRWIIWKRRIPLHIPSGASDGAS